MPDRQPRKEAMSEEETTIESIHEQGAETLAKLQMAAATGVLVLTMTTGLDQEGDHSTCEAAATYLRLLGEVVERNEAKLVDLREQYLARAGETADLEQVFKLPAPGDFKPPAKPEGGQVDNGPGLYL